MRQGGERKARHEVGERNVFAGGGPSAARGEKADYALGRDAGFAVGGDSRIAMALREAAIVGSDDEWNVAVAWGREAEGALKHYLGGGSSQQIVAANDLGDAHGRIIHDNGKGVAGAELVARNRKIAKLFGDALPEGAGEDIIEQNNRVAIDAKAPAWDASRKLDGCAPGIEASAACAGVVKLFAGVGGRLGAFDILARTDARIRKAKRH